MPTDATKDRNWIKKVFLKLSISGLSMTLEYLFIQSSNEFFIVSYFLLKKYFHLAIVTIILYNLLTMSTKMQVSLKVGWHTWILEDSFARPFCFLRVVCSFRIFGYAMNLIEFSSKNTGIPIRYTCIYFVISWSCDRAYLLDFLHSPSISKPSFLYNANAA